METFTVIARLLLHIFQSNMCALDKILYMADGNILAEVITYNTTYLRQKTLHQIYIQSNQYTE